MMTRAQRIEYEILDCVLNRATHGLGYISTTAEFTVRLRQFFTDAEQPEFLAACLRLNALDALELIKNPNVPDDAGVSVFSNEYGGKFYLHASTKTREYFEKLLTYIDAPPGFKRPSS